MNLGELGMFKSVIFILFLPLVLNCGGKSRFASEDATGEKNAVKKSDTKGDISKGSESVDQKKQSPTMREVTLDFKQVARPIKSISKLQGVDANNNVEEFTAENIGIIDILIVLDDSSSMSDEIAKVANNLPQLLEFIGDSNWQIRTTTTTPTPLIGCNLLQAFNSESSADPSREFKGQIDALRVFGGKSGNEQGILQAVNTIGCSLNPWVRNDSDLVVLFVSDEDNCSDGDCNGRNESPMDLKNMMESKIVGQNTTRTFGVDSRIYGLFWIPGENCDTAYNVGNQYHSLVADSNGYAGSICDQNFDNTFRAISEDIRLKSKKNFKLQYKPENNLQVFVNESLLMQGKDYLLSNDTILFQNNLIEGSTIRVEYSYGSTDKINSIDLPENIDDIVEVKILNPQGATTILESKAFKVINNSIVFEIEPEAGSEIIISYRDKHPDFSLISKYEIGIAEEGSIIVKVNNISYTDFKYDGNWVKLDPPPPDESDIEITFIPKN